MTRIPIAFEPLPWVSPFNKLVGRLYVKSGNAGPCVGLMISGKHVNRSAIVHGGMICTLADMAMGHAIRVAHKREVSLVTVNLAVDFIGIARTGDWVEAHANVHRIGKRLAFADCHVWRAAERIARASGTYQIAGTND